MEINTPKIELYRVRTFSEKFSATFDFVSENWRVLLKYLAYFILPFCLIQSIAFNSWLGNMFKMMRQAYTRQIADDMMQTYIMGYVAVLLTFVVASFLMNIVVYSLLKLYFGRENRLQGLTFRELLPTLKQSALRIVVAVVVGCGLGIVVSVAMVILTLITPLTLIVTYPGLIICVIPLALLTPIFVFEEIDVIGNVKKTFRLGFNTWGGIFALGFVVSIITYLLIGVLSLPWGIAVMSEGLFDMSTAASNGVSENVFVSFFAYLAGIVQSFGMYLGAALILIAMTFQYGHAAEKLDSVSVKKEIDHFETLADKNTDDFEEFEGPKKDIDDFENL